jgi:aminopeptidase N
LLYNKGAFTLSMLKYWMGKENFSRCLTEFFEAYQFRRVGVQEFIQLAQNHSKEDLKPFFQQWLNQWDIPEIRWSTRTEGSGSDLELKLKIQQRQQNAYKLRIPMVAKSKTGEVFPFVAAAEQREEELSVKLPFAPASVEMDPMHETLMKVVPGKFLTAKSPG